jgi:hypothetical protein
MEQMVIFNFTKNRGKFLSPCSREEAQLAARILGKVRQSDGFTLVFSTWAEVAGGRGWPMAELATGCLSPLLLALESAVVSVGSAVWAAAAC